MLLIDAYPDTLTDSIFKFTHFSKLKDIPAGPIIFGSFKVAFVSILETLISAMIG